jgi:hypothetical protein
MSDKTTVSIYIEDLKVLHRIRLKKSFESGASISNADVVRSLIAEHVANGTKKQGEDYGKI